MLCVQLLAHAHTSPVLKITSHPKSTVRHHQRSPENHAQSEHHLLKGWPNKGTLGSGRRILMQFFQFVNGNTLNLLQLLCYNCCRVEFMPGTKHGIRKTLPLGETCFCKTNHSQKQDAFATLSFLKFETQDLKKYVYSTMHLFLLWRKNCIHKI